MKSLLSQPSKLSSHWRLIHDTFDRSHFSLMRLKALLGAAVVCGAGVASLAISTAANAEARPSIWLVLRYGVGGAGALEKIEMQDMTQCQIQGAAYESSKTLSESGYGGHTCLEGK